MKTSLFLVSLLFGGSLFAQSAAKADLNNSLLKKFNEEAKQNAEAPPIRFVENKGQIHDQNYKPRPDVLFGAMAGNLTFHLKTSGVSYQLTRVESYKEVEDPKTKQTRKEIDQQTIYRVDLNWLNANSNLLTTTDQTLEGFNNYYLESCPDGALNVKSYTGVTVHNLYNGINLHYYEKEGLLKHDYIVAPGANYQQIQLKLEGAEVHINEDGSLTLTTPLGKILEGAPIVYQNGKQLKANWSLKNNMLGFEIENYNPNQELIIDPVTRLWGTYYGGAGADRIYSCSSDAIGNVYVTGITSSSSGTVIATAGTHLSVFGGNDDAFLAKFNSNGVRQWGTYYGGNVYEEGYSCVADAAGNVYMAGTADLSQTNIITTLGVHQSWNGGGNDAFLAKFNSSGVRLWGTRYGGSGAEKGTSCAIDVMGDVYLAGISQFSSSAIATVGSHQTSYGGGSNDAFLAKFNSSGLREWGTYYGGNGQEFDPDCATDIFGNVFLAGSSAGSTVPAIATTGAHQSVYGGGSWDAYIVKFNSIGVRQWGTYYGGGNLDQGYSCATDTAGNVYLVGRSEPTPGTVIATAGAHQTVSGGFFDNFLVKFNSGGVRQWGTYYGGAGGEFVASCFTDATGHVFLTGNTDSNVGTIIASTGTHQTVNGGNRDAYLAKFTSSGVRQWGTYYGGTGDEFGHSCAVDNSGNVYLTGHSTSTSGAAIVSTGAHQDVYGGGTSDAFFVKFHDECSGPSAVIVNQSACDSYTWPLNGATYTTSGTYTHVVTNASGCALTTTLNLTINNSSTATVTVSACDSYTWALNGTSYTTSGTYTHVGTNASGCPLTTTLNLTINNSTTAVVTAIACDSYTWALNNTTYTSSGAYAYTLVNSVGCDSIVTLNLTINNSTTATVSQTACYSYTWPLNGTTYTSSGTYTHVGTNAAGCQLTTTLNLTIDPTTVTINQTACDSYTWPLNGTTYTTSGTYTHVGTNASGCTLTTTLNLTINASTTTTVNQTACDSYTWPLNGTTYTASGSYTHVGTNASGCTLTTTLNLTINASTTATVTQTACDSYTWALNGTTYTTSGTYTHVGTNASGCTLTTTLNLTINSVDVSVVVSDPTITANASGASYQWIDCNNGNAIIPGATAQAFTPTANGNYAVILTTANCSDTSACQAITTIGIGEYNTSAFLVYPNPTSGSLKVILGEQYQRASIQLFNALGQEVFHKTYTSTNEITFEIDGATGVYFLEIESAEEVLGRVRVVKN
jgi:hypothetical protein